MRGLVTEIPSNSSAFEGSKVADEVTSTSPVTHQTVDTVKAMAEIMSQHELSEIDIETEAGRIRMRRGPRLVATGAGGAGSFGPVQTFSATAPTVLNQNGATSAAPSVAEPPPKRLVEIKSETLGTFYSKPNPDAEPYVKVGSRVTEKTVVGLIEAMKIFNEVLAGVSGVITEVLVENQQPVEYGTVLFRVDPS